MYSRARHIPTAPAQAQTKELKTVWGREVNLIHPHALFYVQTGRTYPNSSSAGADQRVEDCLGKGGNPHTLFYVQPCKTYPNSTSAGATKELKTAWVREVTLIHCFTYSHARHIPTAPAQAQTKELKTVWGREVNLIHPHALFTCRQAGHIPTAPVQAQTKEQKATLIPCFAGADQRAEDCLGKRGQPDTSSCIVYVQTGRTYPNSSSAGADQRAEGNPHILFHVQPCKTYPNSTSAGADQRAEDCLGKRGQPDTSSCIVLRADRQDISQQLQRRRRPKS